MRNVYTNDNGLSVLKLRGSGDRLCVKTLYTRRDGTEAYAYHYLTYEDVQSLAVAVLDWLDSRDEANSEGGERDVGRRLEGRGARGGGQAHRLLRGP